jgi:hypothetical protein
MSSIERKHQRKNKKKKKKKLAKEELEIKIALFDKLPKKCLTCEEPFDKMVKEQVMTWNVVVDQKKDVVRLYCPTCFDNAKRIISDFEKHLKEKYERKQN